MGRTIRADRAKLFIPFDALKGLRAALLERERITVPRIDISEDMAEDIDRKLHQIRLGDIITVIYYDKNEYVKITGVVSAFSETSRSLTIVTTSINFDDIRDIQGNFPE